MRCTASELEIETIFNRISNGDIDLQPDFQRGEVWSIAKKKKLIDSIMRGWRIPPVHVIENKKLVDEVLDGQQRLASIRDFMEDKLIFDGNLSPYDSRLISLSEHKYSELNEEIQRKFRKYIITIIRLTEYSPEEPAELFFRLNQPATLTSAEQRNAFVGGTRDQIRHLVSLFEANGARKDTIGFSNSRMAYDEVISKFCYILETGTLRKKITSADISDKYRHDLQFGDSVICKAKDVLNFFVNSVAETNFRSRNLSLNKATLFSWLIFAQRHIDKLDKHEMGMLIFDFESYRQSAKGKEDSQLAFSHNYEINSRHPYYQNMFMLFNQKASMGSTDANSIIIRDIILEIFAHIHTDKDSHLVSELETVYSGKQNLPLSIEILIDRFNWGGSLV